MNTSNTDDTSCEPADSGRLPGDELYMMAGEVYVLCSVRRPSTRWIATDAVDDLGEWR
ncbi:hypothetical protein [Natronococcus pandeyae]|uniref:hypothetical protein n=1 Tax=Natronococcus pandeyae TaxID=2055836 RepID=UPI0016531D4D|nr:hypothetical protein [Natronococcus pandeyae]